MEVTFAKQQSIEIRAPSDNEVPTTAATAAAPRQLGEEERAKEEISENSLKDEELQVSCAATGAIKKTKFSDVTVHADANDENAAKELAGVSEEQTTTNRNRSVSAVNNSYFGRSSVDDELTALRKRVEVLKLEKEILELRTGETQLHQPDPQILFEDAAEFVDHIERVVIDEVVKFLAQKDPLTGIARLSLSNDHQSTFDDVRAGLLRKYSHCTTRPEIYTLLKKRQKKPYESVRQYILEMEALAYRGDLAEFELVAFILNGLEGRITDYALFANSKSIAELKDAANILEYREILRRHSSGPFNRKSKGQIGNDGGANRCYNCSRFGHFKSECPYEDRPKGVCFKCWQPDHANKECENPKYIQQLRQPGIVRQSAEKEDPNVAGASTGRKPEEVIPEVCSDVM